MTENIPQKETTGRGRKIVMILLKSPVNLLFGLALLYYAFRIYVLGQDALFNKVTLLAIIFMWLIWYLFKNVIKLILLAFIIAFGAYGCYYYSHQDQRLCEKNGGVWNETSQTCEEKTSWWQKFKNLWENNRPDIRKSAAASPDKNSSR